MLWVMASIIVLGGGVSTASGAPEGTNREPTLAQRLESVQNLSVSEAIEQIRSNWAAIMLSLGVLVLVFLLAAGMLRPGGLKKAMRDVKPYPSLVWLFVAAVVMLAAPLAADTLGRLDVLEVGAAASLAPWQRDATIMGLGTLIAMVVGLGLVYVMHKSAPDAGLRIGPVDLFLGVGCLLMAMPLIELASLGAGWMHRELAGAPPPAIAHETLQTIIDHRGDAFVLVLIGVAVVGAPVVEEVIFRGGVQSAALRLFGSPLPAIVVTSVLFTLVHLSVLPAGAWHALATLFVLSLALGIAFERTKRLGTAIAMHAAFNALNIVLALSIAGRGPAEPPAPEAVQGEAVEIVQAG